MKAIQNGIWNLRKCWRAQMTTISDINTCSFDIIVLAWRGTLNTVIQYSLNENYLISIWMRKLPTNFRMDQAALDCNHTRLHPVGTSKESTAQVSDTRRSSPIGIVPPGLRFWSDLSSEVVICAFISERAAGTGNISEQNETSLQSLTALSILHQYVLLFKVVVSEQWVGS